MFASRYPFAKLIHPRVLRSQGKDRGLWIIPKPTSTPPPEIQHTDSVLVPMPTPGKFIVLEWTHKRLELHDVDW